MNNYNMVYFGNYIDWDLVIGFLSMHLVTWLLFLVMLTNYVKTSNVHASNAERIERKEVLKVSVLMFCSYALMIPIEYVVTRLDFSSPYFPYTVYLLLDHFTVLFLCLVIGIYSDKGRLCKHYVFFGLLCNSALFAFIQIDLLLMYNHYKSMEPWWFWSVFTIGINFFDAVMILVLLSCRDILLLHKLESQFLARRSKKLRVGELK
ncbi:hypothetical protein [Pseudoalteromonas phenolica]|uniref:Uncharacterized protein n=1 Tax=Pseudoalteromonas phenolica TaxID=161398 RepID=A0A0S2K5A6_9GAMM|nr:hypothetical protein [Pseudoalteromonas phenolica]ALO43417.1 hypothetical protein PP2015_2934 [Pseudoalteromonas phenolica]MBE0355424.1 hypothetical protein [Pseudoalteromonas phenolica O-BC30]